MLKRRSVLAATAGWTIVGASAVRAQTWPSQQVKIVVPYIPGGATDTAGRVVAEKMSALLGQQVIVENRGGGNTIIGMDLVAKSKPDGHTLLLGTTTLATNAALGLKQPYDPLKDFQPISTLAERIRHVVQSAFSGRRIVIFSGGATNENDEALYDEYRAIRDGGG